MAHGELAHGVIPAVEHDVAQVIGSLGFHDRVFHGHGADDLVLLVEDDVFEHIKRAPRLRGVEAGALTPSYDVAITGFCRRIASASDLRP